MENEKDLMGKIITEDLLGEAEAIDKEMEDVDLEVPEGLKEDMKKRLHARIEEDERVHLYAQLSDEDRKALEMGKEMLKDKTVHRKKSKKGYVAVAAVAVLVLAMGATSIGGAERIAKMMKNMVGDRAVFQVDTSEDNYIVLNNDEEEAYQELKDVFGVDVVKIVHWPGKVLFLSAEIDKDLQTALLKYEYEGNVISYFISSHHTKSSWGLDVEDKITDEYYIEHEKCKIEVKEYEKPESKIKRYSAGYTYEGLEYYLIGVMEKLDFENLIKNLIFF